MTTVVSPGAEARAGAPGARAERARDWLADQLATPFSFDLFVLDEDECAEHAEVPVYAVPHADSESGKIVLGSRSVQPLQADEARVAVEVERSWP